MLALSKSDSSRSSSSLCRGREGPCEPRACPGAHLEGFTGLGRGGTGQGAVLMAMVHLVSPPKQKPTGLA